MNDDKVRTAVTFQREGVGGTRGHHVFFLEQVELHKGVRFVKVTVLTCSLFHMYIIVHLISSR